MTHLGENVTAYWSSWSVAYRSWYWHGWLSDPLLEQRHACAFDSDLIVWKFMPLSGVREVQRTLWLTSEAPWDYHTAANWPFAGMCTLAWRGSVHCQNFDDENKFVNSFQKRYVAYLPCGPIRPTRTFRFMPVSAGVSSGKPRKKANFCSLVQN